MTKVKSTNITYNININNNSNEKTGNCQRQDNQNGCCPNKQNECRNGQQGRQKKGPGGLFKLLKIAQMLSGGGPMGSLGGGGGQFAAMSSGPLGSTMMAGSFGGGSPLGGIKAMAGISLLG